MTEFVPPGTRWFALPNQFAMKRGDALAEARLAFETWGELSLQRDNAILILTGLSPNAHAASNAANPEPGWWEAMIGPGKAIDTDRWFVICANTLGSCKGSTGAASTNPVNGEAYRLAFPDLSIEDIADAAHALVQGLGIAQLACVIGCSMGGMSALAYLHLHPGSARSHINVSGAAQALPFSIAIRSLQREAIRLDPRWDQGNYTDDSYPDAGMRIARKLGVVTYRSALEWHGRFGRVRLDSEEREEDPFGLEFQVESYLEGHARRFVRQFDPNCYLYLSRSMGLVRPRRIRRRRCDARPRQREGVEGARHRRGHRHPVPAATAGTDRRRPARRRRRRPLPRPALAARPRRFPRRHRTLRACGRRVSREALSLVRRGGMRLFVAFRTKLTSPSPSRRGLG